MTAAPSPDRRGPLREPQFRLLWIGQSASLFGDALLQVAIAFAVLEIGGSAADVGIVFAASMVAKVALVLAGGVWADRLPRRLVMLVCDAIRAVAELVMAALLIAGSAEVWQLTLTAVIVGAAGAFFVPASTGLVPQVVSPQQLRQANALLGLARTSSNIAGPPISGLLIALSGTGTVFAIDGITFVISALALLRLQPRPATASVRTAQRFVADLVAGWREVVSRRWILASICAFAVGNMAGSTVLVLGPIIAEDRLGGAATWGFILTGTGVGGVIGGIIALRVRPSRPLRVGFAALAMAALPGLGLAGGAPALVITGAMAGATIGIELINTWWMTLLQERIPDEALSRVSSYDWLVSLVFQPAGFLLAGPLALSLGTEATLFGAAVLILVVQVAVLSVRDVRDLTWDAEVTSLAAA